MTGGNRTSLNLYAYPVPQAYSTISVNSRSPHCFFALPRTPAFLLPSNLRAAGGAPQVETWCQESGLWHSSLLRLQIKSMVTRNFLFHGFPHHSRSPSSRLEKRHERVAGKDSGGVIYPKVVSSLKSTQSITCIIATDSKSFHLRLIFLRWGCVP